MATVLPEPDIAAWPHVEGVPNKQQLFDWAVNVNGDRPPLCLVRGGNGCGKSRLLAWFLAGAAAVGHSRTTVHATVPADGLTADTFAWDLGRQLGYGPLAPDRLLNQVAADRRPTFLLVPDLHRAGRGAADLPQADPATLVTELVGPLLALPHVRAVIEVGDSGLLAEHPAEIIEMTSDGGPLPTGEQSTAFVDLIAAVPRTAAGRPDWAQAPADVRERVLDQALHEAGSRPAAAVQGLLTDPGFLVYGPARAITAAMDDGRVPLPRRSRRIWRRAAPQLTAADHGPTERAALLHAAALGDNDRLAEYLRPLAEQGPWTATRAQHETPASAQCQFPEADGQVLISDPLGRLHLHDLDTGQRVGTLPALPGVRPAGIVGTGPDALLVLGDDGALHVSTAGEEGGAASLLGHIVAYHTQAAFTSSGSQPTALGATSQTPLAVVGDVSGAVHLWSLTEYRSTPHSQRLHSVPVTAACCLHLPDDETTFVMSGGFDGTLRLWETSQAPMGTPVDQRPALVTALAAADTMVGPVLAAAWNDGELHIWHILSGKAQVLPLLYRCSTLTLSASGQLLIGGPDGIYAVQLGLDRLRG